METPQLQTDEPLREVDNVRVVTSDRSYRKANIEQYPYWTKIHTSREEPNTEPRVWVWNGNIKTIEEGSFY